MPAAIAIPLIAAAASGTAAVVSSKINANAAENASRTQSASTDKATALATSDEAERRREFDQQQAEAKRQWDTEQANKAPYRQVSSDALLRVRDLLGLPAGAPVTMGAGSTANASGQSTGARGGSAADLKALIDGGMNPQQAAQAFNQKFGRSTGNEAVYYAPSAQTSGKAVLGLPDAYISQEPQGWAITQRGGGAPAARPQTAMSAAMPKSLVPSAMGPATQPNYTPVIPFSQLMSGVR